MCMCRYAWEIVRLYKYTYICLHGFVCMHIYRIYNNLCQAMPQSHMYDATFLANTQIGREQNSWNGGHGFRGKPESYIPIWTLSKKFQFSSPMLLEIYSNHFFHTILILEWPLNQEVSSHRKNKCSKLI